MVSRYGFDVVLKYFIIAAFLLVFVLFFLHPGIVKIAILTLIALSALLILNFFRDPEREIPEGRNSIVSPADGKVFLILKLFEPEYLNENAVQISIFMSPLNVHVNRFPISGRVGYFKHINGQYTAAFRDNSSELNERTLIGVEDNGYKVLFRQVAGKIARRIVADVTVGQTAARGERFGMIKFGSRVDVIIPGRSEVKVKLHEKVIAGETILASYSS